MDPKFCFQPGFMMHSGHWGAASSQETLCVLSFIQSGGFINIMWFLKIIYSIRHLAAVNSCGNVDVDV